MTMPRTLPPLNGFGAVGRTTGRILSTASDYVPVSPTSSVREPVSMYCKHYFGRVVKSLEGVPCDYQRGCLAGNDLEKCCEQCPDFCPLEHETAPSYTLRQDPNRPHNYTFDLPESAVTDIRFEDGPVYHDRYWNRQFPKNYQKKKKAKRRAEKQARRKR